MSLMSGGFGLFLLSAFLSGEGRTYTGVFLGGLLLWGFRLVFCALLGVVGWVLGFAVFNGLFLKSCVYYCIIDRVFCY